MRRQTMQCFFIFLIMVVSLILNFSSLAHESPPPPLRKCFSSGSGQKDDRSDKSKEPPPPCSTDTIQPAPYPILHPPPPPPPTLVPHSPPPPSTKPLALKRVSPSGSQKLGKVIGLVFLGIAGVLQVGVVSYLVFKRRQITRTQDETRVGLVR